MSEEENRKRGRDDEPEGYDARDAMDLEADADADVLPPHMMGDAGDTDDNGGVEGSSAVKEAESGDGGRKRQRRMQLSMEIEKAYELTFELSVLGDQKLDTPALLGHASEGMAFYWNDVDFSESLMKFLGSLVVEMPHKNVILSGLIMLGNSKNEKIGKEFLMWLKERVEEVMSAVSGSVDEEDEADKQMNLGKCWNRVVLCLRMIALLSNLIEDVESVVDFVKTLLQYAVDLQRESEVRVPVAELLQYELLISLPYFLVNNKEDEGLKGLLKSCIEVSRGFEVRYVQGDEFQPVKDSETCVAVSEFIKTLPDVVDSYLDDMRVFYNVRSVVDPLLKVVASEKGKVVKEVEESDVVVEGEAEIEVDVEVEFVKHVIGEFKVAEFEHFQTSNVKELKEFASIGDKLWTHPRYRLKVFSVESNRKELGLETLPGQGSYESIIINDVITHLITNLEYNRVSVSRNLLNFTGFFNEKMFCKSNSSLDKLLIIKDLSDKGSEMNLIEMLESNADLEESTKRDMIYSAKKIIYEFEQGFTSTWKMEEIVLETITDFIFLVPGYEEELPLIYFESLIADTCGRDWTLVKKSQSNSNESLVFSKLVGDCFRYFYENIEKFEFENIGKFVNWMLMQISNFKFEWEWQEWISDVIQLGDEKVFNPKIYFIKNVIHKEILVTNYKFIRDRTLPGDFKKFVNLSLRNREELVEFDSKFFGAEFSEKFSNNPFESELEAAMKVESEGNGVEEYENVAETNTDIYKLFSHYLFNHDEHPFNDLCRDIYMNLENVEETEESLIELIEKLRERIINNDDKIVVNSEEYIMTLITESICLIGSRSFSVFEESLNKVFGDKLKKVFEVIEGEDSEKERWIINGVLRIWNNEPRIGLLFVEKISKYGILNKKSVIESVFRFNKDKLLPLSEIYADEYLEKVIESCEDGSVERELLVKTYMNECQNVLDTLGDVVVDNLDEQSSEVEWKKKNLIGLMVSKQRKYNC